VKRAVHRLADRMRLPWGIELDSRVRSGLTQRWHRLRIGAWIASVVLGGVVALVAYPRAGAASVFGVLALLHALLTRKRPQASIALAMDITLGFVILEIVAVPTAVLAIVYMTFVVIVVLLCTAIQRLMVAILASAVFAFTAAYHSPGTGDLVGTAWSNICGWLTSAIFLGLLVGVVSLVIDQVQRDMEKLDQANGQLEQLVESRDDLIAAISHGIRTPLAGVIGFAAELNEEWFSFSAEELREIAGDIAALGTEIEYITEDLTVAARSELGTLVTRSESVELHGETLHFVDQWSRKPDGFEVIGESCYVQVDRLRLRQILRSLLTNAIEHGGRRIWVEVGPAPDGGAIRVCDDGEGVPDEFRDQVFAPYERLHRRPTLAASTGLGLALARGLVEAMGGTLSYRRFTHATVFEVTLPHARGVHQLSSPTSDTLAAASNR